MMLKSFTWFKSKSSINTLLSCSWSLSCPIRNKLWRGAAAEQIMRTWQEENRQQQDHHLGFTGTGYNASSMHSKLQVKTSGFFPRVLTLHDLFLNNNWRNFYSENRRTVLSNTQNICYTGNEFTIKFIF